MQSLDYRQVKQAISSAEMRIKLKKHSYVLLSVLFWGCSGFLADRLNQVFTPALQIFVRFLISGILLILPVKKNREPFRLRYIITGGLGVFGYYILMIYALAMSSVSFVALMEGSLPVLAVIFDRVIIKQRCHGMQAAAALVSLIGIFLYSFDADIHGSVTAAFLMAAANLSWLTYCFLKKKWSAKEDIQILGYEFAAAALLTLPLGFTFDVIGEITLLHIMELAGLVLFATIIPYWLYLKGSKELSLKTASMYLNLLPVASLLPVIMIAGFQLTAVQVAGIAVLIISAVIGR